MILYILHSPLLMAWKSCCIFFISTLLVYNMSYQYFFRSLVNDKFSNLKLNVFIITGFNCSNKYMKQVVLINHSWISPRYKGDGDWSSVYSPKNGGGYISPKKGRGWQNIRGWFLRESNLCLLLIFILRLSKF